MKKILCIVSVFVFLLAMAMTMVGCGETEIEEKNYFVTFESVEGITFLGTDKVKEGEDYSFSVNIAGGYYSVGLEVLANGQLLVDRGGRYTVSSVSSDLVISARGLKKVFNVSLPSGEGYTVKGNSTVNEGDTYSFEVTTKKGYTNLVVKEGDSVLTPSDGYYRVSNVNKDIVITVEVERTTSGINIAKKSYLFILSQLTEENKEETFFLDGVSGTFENQPCDVVVDLSSVDFTKSGTYEVTYSLADHSEINDYAMVIIRDSLFIGVVNGYVIQDASDISFDFVELRADGSDKLYYIENGSEIEFDTNNLVLNQSGCYGLSKEYLKSLTFGEEIEFKAKIEDVSESIKFKLTDDKAPVVYYSKEDSDIYVLEGTSYQLPIVSQDENSIQELVMKYSIDGNENYSIPTEKGLYTYSIKVLRRGEVVSQKDYIIDVFEPITTINTVNAKVSIEFIKDGFICSWNDAPFGRDNAIVFDRNYLSSLKANGVGTISFNTELIDESRANDVIVEELLEDGSGRWIKTSGTGYISLSTSSEYRIWLQADGNPTSGSLKVSEFTFEENTDFVVYQGDCKVKKVSDNEILFISTNKEQKICLSNIDEIVAEYSFIELEITNNQDIIWIGNDVWTDENPEKYIVPINPASGVYEYDLRKSVNNGEYLFIIMSNGAESGVNIKYTFKKEDTSTYTPIVNLSNSSEGSSIIYTADGFKVKWSGNSSSSDVNISAKEVNALIEKGYEKLSMVTSVTGKANKVVILDTKGVYHLIGVGKVVIPLEKDTAIFIWIQEGDINSLGTLVASEVNLIQKVSSNDDWIPDINSTAKITKVSDGKISLTADGYQKIYLNKISEILKDYSLIELKVSGNVGNIWFGNDVWGGDNPNAKMRYIPAGGGETTVSLKDMIKEGEPFFIIMPEGDETEVIITYSFISASGVGALIPITNNSEGRGTLKENVEDGYIILNWAISSHNQDMVITAKSVEELLKKGYNKLSFNLEFSGEMTRMIIRRSTGDYALLEGTSCSILLQSGVSYYIWVQNVDIPSTGTVKIKDIKYESMEWIPDGNRPAQYTQVEHGKIKFSATDHEQKLYYGFIDIKAKEYDLVEIHVSGNQNHIWIGNDVWVGESVYMSSIAPGGGEIILELSKLVSNGSGKLMIMSHGVDETGGESNVEIQYTFYKSGGGPFNLVVNNGANLKVSDTEMKITFTSVSNENTVYISTEEVASLINSGVKSITFTLSTPTDDAARIIIMERINTQYPLVYTGTTTEYTLQLVQGQSYALFIQNSQAYNIKGVLEITNIVLNRDSIE